MTPDLLAKAIRQLDVAIAGVGPDQLGLPTACRSWDVRALLNHLVHDARQFTARARGGDMDWTTVPDAGPDWLGAYRTATAELLEALPASEAVPEMEIVEFAVHAWDLIKATGQEIELDPEIALAALAWGRGALQPEYRGSEEDGKVFGPEVEIAEDRPPYDRLAAFFGRHPE